MTSSAYSLEEVVAADEQATVYRALRRADRRPVLLKALEEAGDVERLRNELAIAGSLDRSKVLRPLLVDAHEGKPTLVRDGFDGVPLERLLHRPLDTALFLRLAIAITSALEYVHQVGLVHKDLTPRSIFVRSDTGDARLSEFGIAARIPRQPPATQPPDRIEGTLPYMSPEQTGRTNRAIDSRSDLYSLGVVFFQMLTARLPFTAGDPLAWIHAHVARPTPSPREVCPAVPPIVADIVLRLMAKLPEARYQSARGVRHDLERARDSLAAGRIEPFALAELDVSDRLKVPQHLYGREPELQRLRHVLQETAQTGRPALALVSGSPGVGKSSLVYELLRSIEHAGGTFLSGKFEAQQRNIPYSTIARAFRRILRDLLGGSEESLRPWRACLTKALGNNGRLVADIVPETELLLGPQPPVAPLPPVEAEQRVRNVLRAFIAAFGRSESPLVLFLDDLQWADIASLQLLQHLLTHDAHHILVIGAYRNNEVGASHPLARTLAQMRAAEVPVSEVVLGPLAVEHIVALTADSLHRPATEVRPLAQLVHEKTGGNPFFVIQFLDELTRDGLLAFDADAWRWCWNLEAIRRRDYTANVADFMVERMARLPPETRDVLRLAACVGSTCDAKTLTIVARSDQLALDRQLLPALEQGLLVRGHDAYQFAHDRVRQAAYSLLPEAERPAIHRRMGHLLLRTTPTDSLDDRLFEIVNHLNRGIALVTERSERVRLAELDLAAGRKARDAAAPVAAVQYLHTAIHLLVEEGWERAEHILRPAHLLMAECEFLLGNVGDAYRLLETIERHSTRAMDRAPGRNLRAWFLTSQGSLVQATEYGIETARLLGLELPSPHDAAAVRDATAEAFAAYQAALAGRSVESLADLPPVEGLTELAILDTISGVIPATFQWNPDLHVLLVLKAVLLAAPHYTAPAFLYAQYGVAHSQITGDYDTALRFGELALRLVQRPRDRPAAGATHFIYGAFLAHFKRHISISLQHLEIALRLSHEAGDLAHVSASSSCGPSYRLYAGEALESLRPDVDDAMKNARGAGDVVGGGMLMTTKQAISALQGRTSHLARLEDDSFREAEFEALAVPSVRAHHCATKAMICFVGGDPNGALEAADAATPLPGLFYNAWTRFYRGLALARRAATSEGLARDRCLRRLTEDARFVSTLAEHCPANHGHRDKLLRAEIAMLAGDTLRAHRLYDLAVAEARAGGFLHEQALGCELASHALRTSGLETAAELYLDEARQLYRAWGADAKVQQLEHLHPSTSARRSMHGGAFAAWPETFDMIAVVKAAQAISGELTWERVTQRLLEVAIEHSGASYGCLLFKHDSDLLVAAYAHAEAPGVVVRRGDLRPLDTLPVVPASIARFVARSGERIIMDAATSGEWYASDAYLRRRRPRSVLCLPVSRRVEVSALLYLENQEVSGAFAREHMTALELIAAQAEIALANTKLFERLERENAERRRAEVFLQQILDNSSALIFVKDLQGRFMLTNPPFDEFFGVAHEEIIGKTDRSLSEPESAESYRTNDRLALEANRPLEFEESVKLPEGTRTYISIKFPLHDTEGVPFAVCGIATDITARKRVEDELRASVSLLQATLESTGDAILVVDTEGHVVRLNQQFLEMWDGKRRDHDAPLPLGELRDPKRFHDAVRHLALAPTETSFSMIELVDGRILECYSQPQRMDERVVGRVWSFRDVTTRARAQRERDALLLRERHARAAAEDAVRLRDEFLSVASHELRTPLTSLQLAIQGLARRMGADAAPPIQRNVELATRQLRRLGNLVDLLLDVSRIQAGRLELERSRVDLSELVHEATAQLAEDLQRSGNELVVQTPGPVFGQWDAARVEQIIINLLTNAIKFGEGRPIGVTVEALDTVARLTVTDQGIGIPEDVQARLFERFGRGVSARHYGGLGLGLYIVRTVVELHGGRVALRSTVGHGATFIVELPRAVSEATSQEVAS